MRAIAYHRFGGPEVLEATELPTPRVGPDSVLVRVHATSVNPVDWKVRQGYLEPLMDTVFPVVPGWDVAGVVERVGLDVPELSVGDEVVGYVRKDVVSGGTTAELVAAPVRTLARKPASLSWEEAAGLPLAGLTAYQALRRLGVGEGETVLVHNAAGGVGALAVQVARAFGARVIGTASPGNHDHVRALGGEPVPYGDGLVEAVRGLVPGGVDAVLDLVGGGVAATTPELGAPGVRLGSVADGGVTELGGRYLWVRPDRADLEALGALADAGRLTVPVVATFDLGATADAHRLSEEGHTAGKVVIRVS
ncbi:NADP-dependent oxidoreductase [Cellulomonas endophytica]|uniref:NADP-dependent oxidoreductase n=1 Tax=Cellulomonas endophytica TaxID=2494735 RepID=UPI0010106FB0|nr:NADP-dependent oxidoreductase [Cellulomonas endophytica]